MNVSTNSVNPGAWLVVVAFMAMCFAIGAVVGAIIGLFYWLFLHDASVMLPAVMRCGFASLLVFGGSVFYFDYRR